MDRKLINELIYEELENMLDEQGIPAVIRGIQDLINSLDKLRNLRSNVEMGLETNRLLVGGSPVAAMFYKADRDLDEVRDAFDDLKNFLKKTR